MQQYKYKIQPLVEKGFDFNTIYPEKQEAVKEMSGYSFSIPEIVDFIKSQTNNFQQDNLVAFDLDDAIYKLYVKSTGGAKEAAAPTPPEAPAAPQGGDKADLENRLKILKKMFAKKPNDEDLKARVRTMEKRIRKMADGGAVPYAKGGIFGDSQYNTGRSWHLDRYYHNTKEDWEKPMRKRKLKYFLGGGVGDIPVSEEKYSDMRDAVPPIYITTIDGHGVMNGFAVGEAYSHAITPDGHKALYTAYYTFGDKYYQVADLVYFVGSGQAKTMENVADVEYAKGGGIGETYEMTDDTYVNVLLSRGFIEKRGSYGYRYFEHQPSGIFITYTPNGKEKRIVISKDKSGEITIYEGNSISQVLKVFDANKLPEIKEGIQTNTSSYAKGGNVEDYKTAIYNEVSAIKSEYNYTGDDIYYYGIERLSDNEDGRLKKVWIDKLIKTDANIKKAWDMFSKEYFVEDNGMEYLIAEHFVDEYARGGGISARTNYLSHRNIDHIETKSGKVIKGKDVVDGAYVKKRVKFADGGDVEMGDEPKVVRQIFEDTEELEYAGGGGVEKVYEVTQFDVNKYYDYILTESEAIAKFGKERFEKSINANAFHTNLVSREVPAYYLKYRNDDKYAGGGLFGGRLKSALMKDRAYKSDESWEKAYKRKKKPSNPRYKKKS